jgi:cellulose synthase operon protein C
MKRRLNYKLVLSLLGGFAVAAIVVHFVHGYQLRRNAHRLLERAERALEEKKPEAALTYYAQYLGFVPDDADTVQKYARVLDTRVDTVADRVRLVLLMEQVLRVKPNEDDLRLRLVHHQITLDRMSEAIDNLKKLERSSHDRAEILHMLGWCQEVKKDYVQAGRSFEEAIRIKPTQLRTYPLLVEVLLDRLAQPDDAQKVIDDMLRDNSKSYQAHLIHARFERRRGNEREAERALAEAYRLAPDRAEVLLAVADAARVKGNWNESRRLLLDGMKRFPNHADFYRLLADVQLRTKRDDDALKVLQAGLTQTPASHELRVMLIDLLIDTQQYDAARTKIDELRKAELPPALPDYLTARLKVADMRWQEAIQLLEGVHQELGPVSDWTSRIQVLLGVCYRHLGDHEQELQAFRRAVDQEPGWATATFGLGEALLNNGRIEEAGLALEPLRTSADLPPGYWLLLSRARLQRQLRLPEQDREWHEIESALEQAAKEDAKGIAVSIVRAELHTARKDIVGAKNVLETMQSRHPEDIAIWVARADLAARQGRFDDAEKILDQANQRKAIAGSIELRLAQCRLWGLRGDHAKLARLGEQRTTLPSEDRTRLTRELADTWYRLGVRNEAEKLWRDLASDLPRDVRSRFALLELALERKQSAAAHSWLDALKKIEGDQGWLWRYGEAALLVLESRGQRRHLEEARKKLHDLEQHHKRWPRLPVLLGTIEELEGKYQQAIREYTRALDLGETQPRVLGRVVELLLDRREYSKAETEIAKYEQRRPLTRDLARLGAEAALGLRDPRYAKIALKRAEQAIDLPARDYRDALWIARVYDGAGESKKAETLLRQALVDAGHAPDVWIAWFDHLIHTNQREQALRDLEPMKKKLAPILVPFTLARAYEVLRFPDQADAAYQQALRDRPGDVTLLAHAADFYRRAERRDEARKWYERLLDPSSGAPANFTVRARREFAVLLADQGARASAIEVLDRDRKARGDTVADERVRLYLHSLTDSAREGALGKFEDSLRLQPPTPEERVLYARMLEAAGYLAQARSQLAEAVAEQPVCVPFLIRYARILIRTEDLDEARRQLTRVEALEPGSARVRDLRRALAPDK